MHLHFFDASVQNSALSARVLSAIASYTLPKLPMQAESVANLFQTTADLVRQQERELRQQQAGHLGEPVQLPSKPLALVVRSNEAWVAESGFVVRRIDLVVRLASLSYSLRLMAFQVLASFWVVLCLSRSSLFPFSLTVLHLLPDPARPARPSSSTKVTQARSPLFPSGRLPPRRATPSLPNSCSLARGTRPSRSGALKSVLPSSPF